MVRDPDRPRPVPADLPRHRSLGDPRRPRDRHRRRDDRRHRHRPVGSSWPPSEQGKHIVTANKALLAEHGDEVFAEARRQKRAVAFEASVGGGIPIIQALSVGLAANRVQAISAILNGTCNFILTAMTRDGTSYDEALAQAQSLGYAEADPTLDVDGTDTAHKLAVLARVAFGAGVRFSTTSPDRGSTASRWRISSYAGELGYAVKLLALARLTEAGLALRVAPRLVRAGDASGGRERPLQRRAVSSATRWATPCFMVEAPARCPPPPPWWPT